MAYVIITPLDWIQMHPKSVPLSRKYSYKQLLKGILGFPDIFQGKMSEQWNP
jgi:hypothetical protein